MRYSASSAIVFALVSACSPYVNRGETLYREGRYIEAAEVFERTETKLKASPSEVCAEYGLYRGLTYMKLDDLRNAHVWLTYASAVEHRQPGQLTSDERGLLEHAWRELGERIRSRGPVTEEPEKMAVSEASGTVHLSGGAAPNGRRSVGTE